MKFLLVLIVTLAFVSVKNVCCKVFTKCELAKELLEQGFPYCLLNNWVCLVESESAGNTTAISKYNTNGSQDYGLFQINDRYWCSHGTKGNGCDMDCNQLLTDDITDASICAKHIYSISGFNAWRGWEKKCKEKNIPDVIKQCKL